MTNDEIYEALSNNAEIASDGFETAQQALGRMADMFGTLARKGRVEASRIPAMADDGVELDVPEYEDHDTIIPPPPTASISDGVNDAEESEKPDTDVFTADILRALRKVSEPQTIGQVAMVLGSKPDAIRPALVRLVESGVVVKSGEKRGTRYGIAIVADAAE